MKYLSAFYCFFLIFSYTSQATFEKEDGRPWNAKMDSKHPAEKPLSAKFPEGGFFFNLGPTGIRARIYPAKPTQFDVKFVFQDKKSPAAGQINAGDIIIGANGKKFEAEHYFGRREYDRKSMEGPLTELAACIEDSQAGEGRLELIVWPGGKENEQKVVSINIERRPRFTKNYPYDCPRSEKMLKQLCDFMEDQYDNGWGRHRQHTTGHSILALMASGDKKYKSMIKRHIDRIIESKASSTWSEGYNGIVLGEYYLLHKDKSLIPRMKETAKFYDDAMLFVDSGRYSHRTYQGYARENRRPYASMAVLAGLSMTAMSLFKEAGLEYHEPTYEIIHKRYLASARPENVKISYAFPKLPLKRNHKQEPWGQYVVVKLTDPSKGLSGKGVGFRCPTGMKDLGKYTIVWPKKEDWDYSEDTSWLEDEKETNTVTEYEGAHRRIERHNPKILAELKEPTKEYRTSKGCNGAPVPLGAFAHFIGNKGNKPWSILAKHCANTAALDFHGNFGGHATTHMATFWQILGAAQADKEKARAYLDYMKTFLIISETHYGSMIIQPWQKDRLSVTSDIGYGPLTLPTASAAILLSLREAKLQITGAFVNRPPIVSKSKIVGPVKKAKPQRVPLSLNEDQKEKLDRVLLGTLVKMSKQNKLKPVPLVLSKSSKKIALKKVMPAGILIFETTGGGSMASFTYKNMIETDKVVLARLVAALQPENKSLQAMAGIYIESIGNSKLAGTYFKNSDKEALGKVETLLGVTRKESP